MPARQRPESPEGGDLYYLASFLTITTGLILFGIGTYGLLDANASSTRLLTVLLRETSLGPTFDDIYLGLLAFLGFWLTIGLWIRIPAGIALGLVMGKLLIFGDLLPIATFWEVSLTLIIYAVLLRLLLRRPDAPENDIHIARHRFW